MERYVPLKTSLEVNEIRKVCKIVATVLSSVKEILKKGITTDEINQFCDSELKRLGARSSLLGYRGFPKSICTAVNHVAAHGIPDNNALEEGDIITIDLTAECNRWHGDAAWTYALGGVSQDAKRLVKASWQATAAGCRAAVAGGRLGDIGAAIQETASKYGCSILKNYVGHGIGRDLHEEPMVLNSGKTNTGLPIVPGMVFTVEPILTIGNGTVKTLEDGWTVVEKGGGLCAQFEHTVAIFGQRTEVLTFPLKTPPWEIEYPPDFKR